MNLNNIVYMNSKSNAGISAVARLSDKVFIRSKSQLAQQEEKPPHSLQRDEDVIYLKVCMLLYRSIDYLICLLGSFHFIIFKF